MIAALTTYALTNVLCSECIMAGQKKEGTESRDHDDLESLSQQLKELGMSEISTKGKMSYIMSSFVRSSASYSFLVYVHYLHK